MWGPRGALCQVNSTLPPLSALRLSYRDGGFESVERQRGKQARLPLVLLGSKFMQWVRIDKALEPSLIHSCSLIVILETPGHQHTFAILSFHAVIPELHHVA